MPIVDNTFTKNQDEIVAEFIAGLQAAVSDAHIEEDSIFRIIFTIEAGQLENAFLGNQLLLEDVFIQTAGQQALQLHGEQYGFPMQVGTVSEGMLQFEGDGGTFVPVGTEAGYDPGGGLDVLYFETVIDGTIPNPGIPTAPTAAVGSAGAVSGTAEYVVTFVTASGEGIPSAISSAVVLASQQGSLTNVPVGGSGTTQRKIYRRENGTGNFKLVGTIANNTATTFSDNTAFPGAGSVAPTVDTARRITVEAQAQDVGAEGNVTANTIIELTNAPDTLTAVTNPASFTGGSPEEDIEDYRARLLEHVRNPATGSADDLKTWAEEIPGVETATVFPNDNLGTPQNGHVTVRISGPNGSIPSAETVAEVQEALTANAAANVVIHVGTFTGQATNVTVDVTLEGTYTLVDVTPSVQQAVTEYINSLEVGASLLIAGITDAVFGLPGIADVVVTSPATNQTTAATTKRTPGTVTVV